MSKNLDHQQNFNSGPRNVVSTKFSSQLVGRHHTSGVSGSMQKHKKIIVEVKKESKLLSTSSAARLSRKEREIELDTERLELLEIRLAEVFAINY